MTSIDPKRPVEYPVFGRKVESPEMRKPLESIGTFQSLQRKQSQLVVFAVLLAPIAATGSVGMVAALDNLKVAIAEGRLIHGSVEALFLVAIGSVLLAAEIVLIRKMLGVRRQLKEILPQD